MDWRKVKAEAKPQDDTMPHPPKRLKRKRKYQVWQRYGATGTPAHR